MAHPGVLQGTGTVGSRATIEASSRDTRKRFHRHYRERWHYSTGTMKSSDTIQPFNRHYGGQWHNLTPVLWTAVALFNGHYGGKWHYSTGTMEGSGNIQPALWRAADYLIIQPALWRAVTLSNRHYGEQWHYSTGTMEGSGTIKPVPWRAVTLFSHSTGLGLDSRGNSHYSTGTMDRSGHYPTGTMESSDYLAIQPAVYRAVTLSNRHYEEQWHYSTDTIEGSGTIQPALWRAVTLFSHSTSTLEGSYIIIQPALI